jgi:signal transduction histidine kinase
MRHLQGETLRLAATYLTIIMVMSVGFSTVFYNVSLRELDRRPPSAGTITDQAENIFPNSALSQYLDERREESRVALLIDLVVVNLLTLLLGALLSYLLAEKTLRPIEENMEAQAQFVSDASHELRTPLTALLTANEVTLRQKKLSVSEARQVITENVDDIKRLQSLTNSMLGLLREDPTKETWQVLSAQQVFKEAIHLTAVQAEAKRITIHVKATKLRLKANEQQLVQLLTILLDNAIKYSDKKAAVYLTATRQGKYVEFTVRDEGIGMSEEAITHVFTRFYRAEQSRTTPGYGLGLAIAKKITDAHKGKISVKSELGHGSTFTVLFPAGVDSDKH